MVENTPEFEKIRKSTLESYDDEHFYHVKSMINWMRFIKNVIFSAWRRCFMMWGR